MLPTPFSTRPKPAAIASFYHRLHRLSWALLLLATACNELQWNPLDPNYSPESIKPPVILGPNLDLPTLQEPALYRNTIHRDDRNYQEESRFWKIAAVNPSSGATLGATQAAIRFYYHRSLLAQAAVLPAQIRAENSNITETTARAVLDTAAFAHIPRIGIWNLTLSDEIIQTQNHLGQVYWRRFTWGGSGCVRWVMQWAAPAASIHSSTPDQRAAEVAFFVPPADAIRLVGYYCAPAGDPLTPGQAETIVQAIRVGVAPD